MATINNRRQKKTILTNPNSINSLSLCHTLIFSWSGFWKSFHKVFERCCLFERSQMHLWNSPRCLFFLDVLLTPFSFSLGGNSGSSASISLGQKLWSSWYQYNTIRQQHKRPIYCRVKNLGWHDNNTNLNPTKRVTYTVHCEYKNNPLTPNTSYLSSTRCSVRTLFQNFNLYSCRNCGAFIIRNSVRVSLSGGLSSLIFLQVLWFLQAKETCVSSTDKPC